MTAEAGHIPNRVYLGQDGHVHLNGGNLLDAAEVAVPQSLSFSAAAAGANVTEVTISVLDGAGSVIAGVFNLDVWLSDAATGAGLTAVTASGAVAAKASSGTDLVTETAKKALRVQTLATGVYVLSITDTAKTGFFPCGQVPGTGKTVVGTQLVTGNYG
jgi:uncharacterized membrane protein (Fun14 family)